MRGFPMAAATVAGLTFGLFLPTAWSEPPKKVAAPAPPAAAEAKPLTIKAFRLERASAEDVRSAWTDLLGESDVLLPMPEAGGKKKGKKAAGQLGALGGQLGGGGGGGNGGGLVGGGAIGCGFGGMNGMTPIWRASTDERTGQVIVRGNERTVKAAGEVVAVLDRANKAPLPKLEVIRAHELTHAEADETVRILGELEIAGLRLHAGPKVVLFAGQDADLPVVAALVKALDVAGK